MDAPQAIYPKPDWLVFVRNACVLALLLVFFHWIPDLAIWTYAKFGVTLAVDERRMEFVLYVAHLIAGLGFLINLAGVCWASWHYPQRMAYERERSNRLAQSVDVEIAERLDGARRAGKTPSQRLLPRESNYRNGPEADLELAPKQSFYAAMLCFR